MKIAFLINSFASGGAEKVLSQLILEFQKTGHEIFVLSLEREDFYKLDNTKVIYLSNQTGKENGFIKILKLPILAFKLFYFVKVNKIDVVQSHIFRANYVNLLSKLFRSKHQVQIVNTVSISAKYAKRGINNKINLFLIRSLYKYADITICKSYEMLNDLKKYTNTKLEKVIYNPYNIQKIISLSEEVVTDFDFLQTKKYLITVGRLHPDKNQKFLIDTMKFMKNYDLIIIGEGKLEYELKAFSEAQGVMERVHFLGRKENPYKYIAKSTLFVSASLAEGFPNVLVEALICQVPVLFSDCKTGPREILAPNTEYDKKLLKGFSLDEYGVLFNPYDTKGFCDAIESLENDRDRIDRYIKKGSQRYEDFSLETVFEKYKNVIQDQS